ncbi:hypothetical protein [Rhodococcus rhodochrous]|uniref:Uncharacterized protein n=1 Tax=Rhodococcus rhodochrous TaxID=1829 RepID=A0AA47ABT3_RHORH|nr:hypothetical protein [Rhodococcus rhodochrous]UZF46671.1 hypothetical protein KUM34_008390 [Rhodococcus rhodochrous]
MRTLWAVSVVSVLCAVAMWVFAVPQLAFSGAVDVGPFFGLMMVLPTLIGLPCAVAGAVAGTVCVVRQRARNWTSNLMTLGQVVTVALAVTIVVWALAFASTGWELLALPTSLMVGQIVVAAGLVKAGRPRMSRSVSASS